MEQPKLSSENVMKIIKQMKDSIETSSFKSNLLANSETQEGALQDLIVQKNKELYKIVMKSCKNIPDFDTIQEAIDYYTKHDTKIKK